MLEAGSRPKVLSVVLAGGEGKRLLPLTADRAKPAVPFGGHYRLIDFALSNLVNGGYRKIVVLTQYKSHSLDVHLSRTWRMSAIMGNYVTSVPAQMRQGPRWFLGSADAMFQNLNIIDDEQPDYIFVFGADHIYRMDPRPFLDAHIESGAGITVAALRSPRAEAHQFGVIHKDANSNKIREFLEKPADPPGLEDSPDESLVSMGNYIFDTEVLKEALQHDSESSDTRHDIGGDIVPELVSRGEAYVYDFSTNEVPGDAPSTRGYWRDVGTLDSYFAANMDLVAPLPGFSLYNRDWPILTDHPSLPPVKMVRAGNRIPTMENVVIANGSILSGCEVRNSVLSTNVRVDEGAEVDQAVLLDEVQVGAGAVVRRAIVDKNVVIPPGEEIGVDPVADQARFHVSDDGLVVIPKNYRFQV